MLIEKEVISPGTYWYMDEASGLPRKLDATSDLTRYWHDQGSKMLAAGLPIPVPFEHDFSAHPMTPKDKLKNNAGWVKEYRLKDFDDPKRGRVKDALFSVLEIEDEEVARKLPRTIRWTSPWFNSFTDGAGRQWNNVISHLALTTRPRITGQAPFGSIAAALSMAAGVSLKAGEAVPDPGYCLSRAGRLVVRKRDKRLRPQYPMAFSLISGGARFAADEDMKGMRALKDDGDEVEEGGDSGKGGDGAADGDDMDISGLMDPLQDQTGDVAMEELLCDLLNALGVQMPENVGEAEFKRALYEATMTKIKELTGKAQAATDAGAQQSAANKAPAGPGGAGSNPLVQQEQQPMYMSQNVSQAMSLEEINKLPEPMRAFALSMYTDRQRMQAELDAAKKVTDSLRDAKLKEADAARRQRVALLSRISPGTKSDLDAMLALPSMALSMGDGGTVVDPMAQTLAVLEKGLAAIPRLLTTEASALSVQPQPSDGEMSAEAIDAMADDLARRMGCAPSKRAS